MAGDQVGLSITLYIDGNSHAAPTCSDLGYPARFCPFLVRRNRGMLQLVALTQRRAVRPDGVSYAENDIEVLSEPSSVFFREGGHAREAKAHARGRAGGG